MDIKTELNNAVKESMKSGNEVRKRTLRMVLAAIKQIEVDRRISLDDAAVISVLQKEIKLRKEALDEATRANRTDLADDAQAEIDILNVFLPQGLSPEELRNLVQSTILETGAALPSDMGKVMKALLPKIAGRAPGDQVSALVRELLQK
jgi:uncharacterized protein YqeY